jgi:myo-inositol 2-dehydrogenase/D-chiro-inositol 1-dehydrogenase
VEVFGSKGGIIVTNRTPDNALYSNAEGVHAAKPLYFFIERYTDAFVAEMKEFVGSVVADKTPPVTGIDGRIPVVMGLAAWKSYREHRPVKLSEIN